MAKYNPYLGAYADEDYIDPRQSTLPDLPDPGGTAFSLPEIKDPGRFYDPEEEAERMREEDLNTLRAYKEREMEDRFELWKAKQEAKLARQEELDRMYGTQYEETPEEFKKRKEEAYEENLREWKKAAEPTEEERKEIFDRYKEQDEIAIEKEVHDEVKKLDRLEQPVKPKTIVSEIKKVKTSEDIDNLVNKVAEIEDPEQKEILTKLIFSKKADQLKRKELTLKDEIRERNMKLAEKKRQRKIQTEINKENRPYYNQITKQAGAAEVDDARLKRIIRLSQDENVTQSTMNALLNSFGKAVGVRPTALLSADEQEMDKLSIDFLANIKNVLGTARITNREVNMYLSTIPNLLQSPEGRIRVAENMLVMNALKQLDRRAADQIIADNSGLIPRFLEQRVDEKTRDARERLTDMFVNGLDLKEDYSPINPDEFKLLTGTSMFPSDHDKPVSDSLDKIQEQRKKRTFNIKDAIRNIKSEDDFQDFFESVQDAPELDRRENRDKLAKILFSKKVDEMKSDQEKIEEQEQKLAIERVKSGKAKIQDIALEKEQYIADFMDELQAQGISDDPGQLEKMAFDMLGDKVKSLKKQINDDLKKGMGLARGKEKRLTPKQIREQTNKISDQLLKYRNQYLGEKEKLEKIRGAEETEELKSYQETKKYEMPYYKSSMKRYNGIKQEQKDLLRMLTLSEKGILGPVAYNAAIKKMKEGTRLFGGMSADFTGLMTADAQEFDKLSTSFIRNIKDVMGTANITQTEILQYLRSIPSLANTREGLQSIINSKMTLNDIEFVKARAAQDIVRENGYKLPDRLESKVLDRTAEERRDLMEQFIDGVRRTDVAALIKEGENIRAERRRKSRIKKTKKDIEKMPLRKRWLYKYAGQLEGTL